MSTFCGGSTSVPSFTFTELKADYPGGILQSVDLSSINDSDQWIQSTIQKLEDANIIPKPKFGKSPESVDSLEDYSKNEYLIKKYSRIATLIDENKIKVQVMIPKNENKESDNENSKIK